MAWGIPGNVGEIYRKQQSDELKDQLLQQTLAQRIKEYEAEQEYRRQQQQAQAEEQRSNREYRQQQQEAQAARDLFTDLPGGPITPEQATIGHKYAGTSGRITSQSPIPVLSGPGGMSREDTSGPQQFDVLQPTPTEMRQRAVQAKADKEEADKSQLVKILGTPRSPARQSALEQALGPIDPRAAAVMATEPTPAERRTERIQDLEDAARTHRKYNPPAPPNKTVLQTDRGTFQVDDAGHVTPLKYPDTGEQVQPKPTGGPAAADVLEGQYGLLLDRAMGPNFPANRRPATIATAKRYADDGNIQGLKDWIVQTAIESRPVTEQAQVKGRRAAVRAMTDIQNDMQQLRNRGVNTGLISGSIEQIAQNLGATGNKELARIGTRMAVAMFNYRRSMTGVAFGESEGKAYEKISPGFTKNFDLNSANIRGLLDAMGSEEASFWDSKFDQGSGELLGVRPRGGASRTGGGGGNVIEYDAQGNRKKPGS